MSSRPSNLFFPTDGNPQLTGGLTNPMVDIRKGNAGGSYAPDFTNYLNATPYVTGNVVIVALQPPRIFYQLENPDLWISTWRAMMETIPLRVEGFKNDFTVNSDDKKFGQADFSVPTNVTRSTYTLNFTYIERYGMPIWRFIKAWINYGIMNPEARVALGNTIAGNNITDGLPDWYSGTILAMELDPNHRKVNQAHVVANVYPTSTGDSNTIKLDRNSDRETREYTIEFKALPLAVEGVNIFAQEILDRMSITNADPERRRSFVTSINGDVARMATGYHNSIQDIIKEQVRK